MCLSGAAGAELNCQADAVFLFSEDQGRYVMAVAADAVKGVLDEASELGVPASIIGKTGGDALVVARAFSIPVTQLRSAHEFWQPHYMSGDSPLQTDRLN